MLEMESGELDDGQPLGAKEREVVLFVLFAAPYQDVKAGIV